MTYFSIQHLRRFLDPPQYVDEHKQRISALFHYLLLLLIALFSLTIFAAASAENINYAFIALTVSYVLFFLLNRSGFFDINAISLLFCLVNCLYVGLDAPRSGVDHHIILLSLSIITLMSGVLLNWRGILIIGSVSLAIILLDYHLYPQMFLAEAEVRTAGIPLRALLQDFFLLLTTTIVLYVGALSTSSALRSAHVNQELLEQRNRDLEREIHERKEMQFQNERFAEILNLTSDYVGIYTLEGKWLYVNRAAQEFFGPRFDMNANLFDQIDTMIPAWAVKNFTDKVIPAALKDGTWRGEIAFLDEQGQEVPISQVLIAHRNAKGEVEYIAAVLRNITDIKQEQQARERLAKVLDATTDFVPIFTPDGRLLYVNRAVLEFCGARLNVHESIMGQLPKLVPAWAIKQFMEEIMPTASKRGLWQGEFALLNNDGVELPVSMVLLAQYNKAQEVEYFAGVLRDITSTRDAEKERVELVMTQARVQMLRDFMSTVSHDIKSPLATLKTSLYVLDKRFDDAAIRSSKIERMHQQIDKINNMVQDILTISRLEQKPELILQTCNLHELTAHAVDLLSGLAAERKLTFQLETVPEDGQVKADVNELERAIINLVENAINYTPQGGAVTVRTAAVTDGVTLEVQDTGIGIAPEDVEHIFERFYRTSKARVLQNNGTGLGLAIVSRIVELHEGKISVKSELDKGTTFQIWLPKAAI